VSPPEEKGGGGRRDRVEEPRGKGRSFWLGKGKFSLLADRGRKGCNQREKKKEVAEGYLIVLSNPSSEKRGEYFFLLDAMKKSTTADRGEERERKKEHRSEEKRARSLFTRTEKGEKSYPASRSFLRGKEHANKRGKELGQLISGRKHFRRDPTTQRTPGEKEAKGGSS